MPKTRPPYLFRSPYAPPEANGGAPPNHRCTVEDGTLIERDVAIALRDGVQIYADVFRPADETPAPPIIAWGPYGKNGHTRYGRNFPKADVDDEKLSKYTAFEAPDALHWVKHGYAVINVDPRGTWYSEGNATYLSPEEAQDFYDVIEWAGVQPWSNGKVGLSGVSYLTSSQWRVAELNPPHLAAINPWEGWTDTYREVAHHGGIPETSFWPYLPTRWGHGVNQVEDIRAETAEHPFYDELWRSKTADFSRIKVPAYVVASWTDQALHTRGTLEGFKHIRSEQKWLEVHGRKKWFYYYQPESVRRQIAFFDYFLKGEDTEIADWPKVRLEVRKSYNVGDIRAENEWPVARTRYVPLYLDASAGELSREAAPAPSSVSYDTTAPADAPGRATFDFVFDERTEIVGHMKLKLFVSTDAGDDMDLFVAIQKIAPDGEIVPFAYYAQFEDGPVALGWLRVSHRELDDGASTPCQPVLKHQRELKIAPGEIVPVEIEIWPSGTLFEPGAALRVVVQGRDIYDYPKPSVYARHENLVNRGRHTIHTGGDRDSHLLIPLIPD